MYVYVYVYGILLALHLIILEYGFIKCNGSSAKTIF